PKAPLTEGFGANGITWSGGAGSGCRVTNNIVYNNVHCGLKEMGHGGTGISIEANVIFDNGTEGHGHGIYCPADNCTIEGNISFNNANCGIQSYRNTATAASPGPTGQKINRNICFGNGGGGLVLAGISTQVYNNAFAYNGLFGLMYFRSTCQKNVVKNNV